MRILRKLWWVPILILAALIIGFLIWALTPLGPMPEALLAMQSDSEVRVENESWIVFSPVGIQPKTGVIFYPGGRVDARSYAPAGRTLAAQGFWVVITPMPLNLAFLAPGRASDVIAAYPQIQGWVIGGHSLGGAMAAAFAYQNPQLVEGLYLWAAYPGENNDISPLNIQTASISASLDGLASEEEIKTSAALLPPDTSWTVIEGGNHAQFGWYGDQPGDNPATISRQEQQYQALQATLKLIREISSK